MPISSFVETPRFPEDISYGSRGGPTFRTDVFTAQSGFEQRNVLWQDARCKYDVAHGIRDKDDMDTVLAFFYNMRGKATGFRFKDWSDYRLINGNIGTGDGSTTAFQVVKKYTVGSNTFTRNLYKLVTSTLSGVTVNGVAKTEGVDFTVNYNTGVITFSVAPGNTHAIVVGNVEFDVPARFDTDEMSVTLEAFELETWDSIPIVEIRIS